MIKKVITNNAEEQILIKWDGERFAIIRVRTGREIGHTTDIIILNPKEAIELLKFIGSCGGDNA